MIIKNVEVTSPGGQRVDALTDGRVLGTYQRLESGGEGSEPQPFELFLASLATYAGVFGKIVSAPIYFFFSCTALEDSSS